MNENDLIVDGKVMGISKSKISKTCRLWLVQNNINTKKCHVVDSPACLIFYLRKDGNIDSISIRNTERKNDELELIKDHQYIFVYESLNYFGLSGISEKKYYKNLMRTRKLKRITNERRTVDAETKRFD